MHMWFHAQVTKKILNGIYFLCTLLQFGSCYKSGLCNVPQNTRNSFGRTKITFSKIISAFGKKSAQTTYFPRERHYTKIMNFVPVVFPKNTRNSFERQACWDGVCLGSWLSCFLMLLNSKTKYVGQQVFK